MNYPKSYYVVPLFCMLLGIVLQYAGVDIYLEHYFYDAQHHLWPWKNAWLTKTVLHRYGHYLSLLVLTGMVVYFVVTLFHDKYKTCRRYAGYLLLASISGVVVVGILKATTHMYTPWALLEFGGDYPNIRLFDPVVNSLPVGHAFPSGHASGGFALLSVYFLARNFKHRYSRHILVLSVSIGVIFGIAQQMRGAHVMSHDLFAFSICWISCLFWSSLLLERKQSTRVLTGSDHGLFS